MLNLIEPYLTAVLELHLLTVCSIRVPFWPSQLTGQGHFFIILQLWQIHNAEQMILDDMEANPDKYAGKKLSELADDEDFDEENSIEYSKAYYKKALLPKLITVRSLSSCFSILSCIYLTRL